MEFTLKQISWIVIGALGLGGSGYMSMNGRVEDLDKKFAVIHNQMETFTKQLDRIEDKLNTTKDK